MTKAEKSAYDKEYRQRPAVIARERERWATPEHKAARRRYYTSPKGHATQARYRASPKGKQIMRKANALPTTRAAIKGWQKTPQGIASAKRTRKRSGYDKSPRAKLQHWRWSLKRRYNFSEAEYLALLEKQGGVCGICDRPPKKKRLHVDHDHISGKVRGLLCDTCNRAIGMLGDDPKRTARATSYLLAASGQPSIN